MRLSACLATLVVGLVPIAHTQQYKGDAISNTLPGVPGSEIAYFRIEDPSGKNNNLTLTNYYSHGKTNQRLDESKVKRAVIVIHGLHRDPGSYMSNMLSALSLSKDPNISTDSVAIMAPYFPNGEDKNYGYPWTTGLRPNRGSTTNALVWTSSQWAAGGNNQYPYTSTNTSSFDVLDQLIRYFDNTALFPQMNQIVVAGHSLGAQFAQRYAAIGGQLGTRSPVSYWVGNPNSYAWLSTSRPLSTASCPSFDDYREGYSSFASYPMTYAASLVAQGRSAVLANYQSKAINYARGTQDLGDDSSTCAPFTTGANRNERFFNYIKEFPVSCPDPAGRNCDTVDFINTGHDANAMFGSDAGQARLFIDNFYGTGNRSYDFGYPRQQAGDDPFPNPALNVSTAAVNDQTYAGNMTYFGCWSDQSPQTLTNMTYQSSANTIELCTQACAGGNNTIAGLEFGTQCFCGSSLGYKATQVIDSSCSIPCPGNSSETCGGNNRLSLFSDGPPNLQPTPGSPETVAEFYYVDCYTEASSGRALSSKQTTSNSMSLEFCAAFCSGYQYFGTEYGTECYCGNQLGAGANRTANGDCSVTCANAPAEFCGAGNRLTVYQDPDWTSASSSSSSSATNTSPITTAEGSASSPSAVAMACPAANNTVVTSAGKNFLIECGVDHSGGDLTSVGVNSFQACIDACALDTQCVDVSLSGVACYLKSTLGAAVTNGGIWGAKLVAASAVSSSTSTTSLITSSSAIGELSSGSAILPSATSDTTSSSSSAVTTEPVTESSVSLASSDALSSTGLSPQSSSSSKDAVSHTEPSSSPTTETDPEITSTDPSTTPIGLPSSSFDLPSITDGSVTTTASLIAESSSATSLSSPSTTESLSVESSMISSSASIIDPSSSEISSGSASATVSSSTSEDSSSMDTTIPSQPVTASPESDGSTVTSSASVSDNSISAIETGSLPESPIATSLPDDSSTASSQFTITSTGPDSLSVTSSAPFIDISSSAIETSSAPESSNSTPVSDDSPSASVSQSTTTSFDLGSATITSSASMTDDIDSEPNGISTPASEASPTPESFVTTSSAQTSTDSSQESPPSSTTSLEIVSTAPTSVDMSSETASSSSEATITSSELIDTTATPTDSSSTSSLSSIEVISSPSNALSATTSFSISLTDSSSALPTSSSQFTTTLSISESPILTSSSSQSTSSSSATHEVTLTSLSILSSETILGASSSSSSSSSTIVLSSTSNPVSPTMTSITSTSSGTSTTTFSSATSSASVSSTPIACPSSDGSTYVSNGMSFLVECGIDHVAGDMGSVSVRSFQQCVDACATTNGCVAVALSGVACYMKSRVGAAVKNGVFGARLISSSTSSSVISSSFSSALTTTVFTLSSGSPSTFATSTSPTAVTTTSISSAIPSASLPPGFSSVGCFTDSNTRLLSYSSGSSTTQTPQQCALACRALNYKYSGTEYAQECWCSNVAPAPSSAAPSTSCNMACTGDRTQNCGAGNRISVVADNTWQSSISVPPTYNAPFPYGTNWIFQDCYMDSTAARSLPVLISLEASGGSSNATVENCLNACYARDLKFCGLEYYSECWGGNALPTAAIAAGEDALAAGCNYPCYGNKSEACGGASRLQVYRNSGPD